MEPLQGWASPSSMEGGLEKRGERAASTRGCKLWLSSSSTASQHGRVSQAVALCSLSRGLMDMEGITES